MEGAQADGQLDAPVGEAVEGGDPAGEVQGRIRGSGVSMVPNRIREVRIAAAASVTQASWPHTASQVKIVSHPASSAATARSANSSATPG